MAREGVGEDDLHATNAPGSWVSPGGIKQNARMMEQSLISRHGQQKGFKGIVVGPSHMHKPCKQNRERFSKSNAGTEAG